MRIDIAVVPEGGRYRQAGGERAAEAVYKDIDLLVVVFGEHGVNIATVEVPASDVAFELNVVCGFRHGKTNFATKLPLRIIGTSDWVVRKVSNNLVFPNIVYIFVLLNNVPKHGFK